MLLLLSGCNHKELDFSGIRDLSVELDWTNAPDANPSGMLLVAFADGSHPVTKPLEGKYGGSISLPKGNYKLIAYNDNTETLYSTGSDWSTYAICAYPTELSRASRMFTRSAVIPRGRGTESQSVIMEPEQVWTSANSGVTVTGDFGVLARMEMEEATTSYHFIIKNVQNVEHVNDIVATISGMSGSWLPAQHRCSDTQNIIPFFLDADGTTMSGTVRTFGHSSDSGTVEHMLVVYAEMSDGNRVYYTFDVTEAINSVAAEAGGVVDVELEELPLPSPMTNGHGLHPDVSDWEEVNISINMEM